MKRILTASITALAVFVPSAVASQPTRQHIRAYEREYSAVAHQYGKRAPGRNIVRDGLAHRAATDRDVTRSTDVLIRMLTPTISRVSATTTTTPTSTAPTQALSTPTGGLVGCIVRTESGGSATVVNPSGHMGLGQWAESTWLADGGGQYASTPLGATSAQQLAVIQQQVAAGHTSQWTAYDGC